MLFRSVTQHGYHAARSGVLSARLRCFLAGTFVKFYRLSQTASKLAHRQTPTWDRFVVAFDLYQGEFDPIGCMFCIMTKNDDSRRRASRPAFGRATGGRVALITGGPISKSPISKGPDGLSGLAVRELDRAALDPAFSLIELAIPGLDPARWRAFAGSHVRGKSPAQGILALQSERGYLFALCAYRMTPGLPDGPILLVDHVVIPKLVDQKLVMSLLTKSWEDIAKRAGCRAIRTLLPIQRDQKFRAQGLLAAATEFGYRAEATCLTKPLV